MILSLLAPAGTPVTALAAANASDLGTTPGWATAPQRIGNASADARRTVTVLLNIQNEPELARLATAVSTPGSPYHRRYISASTFHADFSPSTHAVAIVVGFLKSAGLHIDSVPDNRLYIRATGTVGEVGQAFGTRFGVFAVRGAHLLAPIVAPSLPGSVGPLVAAIDGLSDGVAMAVPHHVSEAVVSGPTLPAALSRGAAPAEALPGPPPAFVNAGPCSAFWGQRTDTTVPLPAKGRPYVPCGYTPSQLRNAYGVAASVAAGVDGSGMTVGIVGAYAAPTILGDVGQFSAVHGEAPLTGSRFHQINATSFDLTRTPTAQDPVGCSAQSWYGEETLDVEAVHAVAPGAGIVYAGATDCGDAALLDRENELVDHQLVQIISNSWGGAGDIDQLPAALQRAYSHTFLQAAAEGIGIQFSSGDQGDELQDVGVRTVDFPASDPWVTAVGGTSLQIGSDGRAIVDAGWGTTSAKLVHGIWTPHPPGTYMYGGGGGTSAVFSEPAYQDGVVPAALAGYWGGSGRVVPDIAMDADPQTGMAIGETQAFPATGGLPADNRYSEFRIGGTSLASPLFAGMMALADQASGRTIGFANPALYGTLLATGYAVGSRTAGAFHDVTAHPFSAVRVSFNNSVDATAGTSTFLRETEQTGTLGTTPGYDDVTGIGTPYGVNFLAAVGFCC